MTDIVEYPEWVMLRDTMLHDDMGGLGQRIYTSAGSGYTKQKYIRADVVESLRQQLAECQAQRLLELESIRHFAWQHGHGDTVGLLDEKLGGTPSERLRKKAKELG